jgi:hypothetical protein
MPARKGAPAGTLPLAAEERRARVERVRAVADGELAMIEKALLDAQARLPKVLAEVRQARQVIAENTAPTSAGSSEEET